MAIRIIILLAFCLPASCMLDALPASAEQYVVVVLDDSGSMRNPMRRNRKLPKMQAAKNALLKVLGNIPPDTNVGLVLLNGDRRRQGGGRWVFRLGQHDPQEMSNAIRRINANGSTPLGRIMKTAADALLEAREQNRYGTYRLLVVTDGEATDANVLDRHLPDILCRGLTVDVIGVDMNKDHSLATQVHTYRRADDPRSLAEGIAQVFAETNPDDDTAAADFELLEGFPPEIAVASIAALTNPDNQPIGGGSAPPKGRQSLASAQKSQGRAAPSATSPPAKKEKGGGGCFGVFVLMSAMALGGALFIWSRRNSS